MRTRKRGGVRIGQGTETCVYKPPIACKDGRAIPPNTVSRIIKSSDELVKQTQVKEALKRINPKWLSYFNLFVDSCRPVNFKPEDLTIPCDNIKLDVGDVDVVNLFTTVQDHDILNPDGTLFKDAATTHEAMKNLLHAVIELNSQQVQVFHRDAHYGNIAWMGNKLVLHDWGFAVVGDKQMLDSLSISDSATNRFNILNTNDSVTFVQDRKYRKGFAKYNIIIKILEWTSKKYTLDPEILFRMFDTLSILGVQRNEDLINKTKTLWTDELYDRLFALYVKYMDICSKSTFTEMEKNAILQDLTAELHLAVTEAFDTGLPPVPTPGGKRRRRKTRRYYK